MSGEPLNYHDLESSGTGTRLGKSSALQKLAVFVLFVVALLVIATLALVVKLHTGQQSQQDSLDAIRAEMSAGSNSLTSELPDRYIVPSVPSRKYQETRGTCWDFGTIAAVEHQYRLQAIQRGALQPNQFVRFSEQAYGHEIITLCAMSQYHSRCLLPGDRVAFNSTEGGEATLLFSFHNELKQCLLPDSLCPYIPDKDNSSCPGIDQAIPKNPVSFTLQSFSTLYDVESIKAALVHKQYAMPITIPVWTVSYYMPCTDPAFGLNSSHPGCDPAKPSCRPCPPDVSTTSPCCLEHSAPFYNMEGEFRQHHAMQLEAGHVMMLVGYNDEFVTKDGLKGGFIIRNTWRDGVYSFNEFGERKARGSHSIPYFMQTVGEASERLLCPNSYNPRNWYTCGAPTEDGKLSSQLASCTGSDTTSTAQANLVPLELVCDSRGTLCKPDANTIYYNINQTQYGDGLHILCFLQHNTATDAVSEFCLTPTPIDEIATSFVPRTPLSNQDDYCGFYIMPYELYEQSKATFLSGWVNDYQLSFSDSSFAVNSAQFPQFDYSLVKASTMTQQPLPTWTNPLPVGPMSLQAAKQRW